MEESREETKGTSKKKIHSWGDCYAIHVQQGPGVGQGVNLMWQSMVLGGGE